MKYSFLAMTMILLGMAGLVVIVMFESITLDNDSEYYTLKEATEAELEAADKKLDSVDEEYEAACDKYYGLDDILTKLSESVEAIENYIYDYEG